MSRQRRSRRPSKPAAGATDRWRRLRRSPWLLVIPAVVLAAILLVWPKLGSGGQSVTGPGGLPGPLGGSSVAQDVNTLVGKPAPGFTLTDSEGQSYAVTPGQGKPLVLVFHMGIT